MENCLLSGWPNSNGEQNSFLHSSFQVVIGFDGDKFIYDISLIIAYLFYEI